MDSIGSFLSLSRDMSGLMGQSFHLWLGVTLFVLVGALVFIGFLGDNGLGGIRGSRLCLACTIKFAKQPDGSGTSGYLIYINEKRARLLLSKKLPTQQPMVLEVALGPRLGTATLRGEVTEVKREQDLRRRIYVHSFGLADRTSAAQILAVGAGSQEEAAV